MKLRNPLTGLLALFFVVAWCLSGSAAFAKPLVPLRTAWLGEHETFLVWYAREKGWDKAEGLELELQPFESGKNVIDEMQSANWALAGVGAMPALTASLSNRLYIIGIGNDESATNAIYTRDGNDMLKMKGFNPNFPEVYGNPGSVRGKTFLVPKGTSAHYMLSRWLHVLGLRERDVKIVDMQPSEAMKAFNEGTGDAIALWAPQTFEAEKLGLKTVAHSSDCNARQPILIIANAEYANKHKADIVAFLRVYLRSVEMMKSTPAEELADDYMRFYNAWTGKTMTREEAVRDIKDHPVYNIDEQLAMFKQSYGTSELREWLHDIVSFQNENGELDRRELARLERLHYVTDIYLKAVKNAAKK
ncbi:ABC transporter substrate-binding protein [uncultured Bilophila sp.]|uniref:ABC transporter substrate-binding protein n=1 Tax=uncultured Bilophila sp. TaxID=529385 RepID=UPI0025E565DF|nr:ABC transporter substrate-binding protein [uncultured Bilophila sp.]